jgi:general stress protein 26
MSDKEFATREESVKKLAELIKDIRFAMITTIDSGVLRSRPMATQDTEFDGELWFFTSSKSHKMSEIAADPRVNVAYSNPEKNDYVSVSGTAEMVTDRSKMEELWNPAYKAWFPEGLDDPNVCLLKITVDQAEFWDAPSSTIVHIAGFIKASVTGKPAKGGDHGKVNL